MQVIYAADGSLAAYTASHVSSPLELATNRLACLGSGVLSPLRHDAAVLSFTPASSAAFASPTADMYSLKVMDSLYTVCVENARVFSRYVDETAPASFYTPRVSPEEFDRECGMRLRAARNAKRLTLQQVSDVTNYEPSRLGNYESGARPLPGYVAHKLSRLYGVSTGYLFCDDDGLSSAEKKLVAKYRQTDERGRSAIQCNADSQPVAQDLTDLDKTA